MLYQRIIENWGPNPIRLVPCDSCFPRLEKKGGRGLVDFTSEVIAKPQRAKNGRFVAGSGTSSSPHSIKGEGRLRKSLRSCYYSHTGLCVLFSPRIHHRYVRSFFAFIVPLILILQSCPQPLSYFPHFAPSSLSIATKRYQPGHSIRLCRYYDTILGSPEYIDQGAELRSLGPLMQHP